MKKLERLRSFFRFCAGMKWVEENPVGTLKPPKFHQKPTLPFTGEEFERVLAAVEKYPTKNSFGYDNRARLRAFVLLLRFSGLRIRDAVCLRRDRIVDGKLMVYTQKTGQPVYVPLPPVVKESLAKSSATSSAGFVVAPGSGGTYRDQDSGEHYAPWVRSRQIALEDARSEVVDLAHGAAIRLSAAPGGRSFRPR